MIPVAFLRHLADVAAEQTLPRFRSPVEIINKQSSGFDPVTEADREAEKAICAALRERYPDHGILGEEFGASNPDSRFQWIIDPVDGTRAFITGVPTWGTLVGLTIDGDAVTGMMSQPFTGEFYYATPSGAHYEGPGGARVLKTRQTASLSEASLFTTTPAMFKGTARARYDQLENRVRLARYSADCYAFALLAAGQVDIVVESGLKSYDIAALIPIIEQAGGVITTFEGGPAENGGDIIAAATPQLHEAASALLCGAA